MAHSTQFDGPAAADPAPFDWSHTDLGDAALWPPCLRLCVDIMQNTPLAMALLWGPRQILVYNPAYAAMQGAKHPPAPGGRVPAMLPPEWSWNGAALDAAWRGVASAHAGADLQVWRDGAATRRHLDLFYTPIGDEAGAVRGVLCALAPAAPAAAPAHMPGRERLRILVVEDNPDARFLVGEMLATFGHQVQALGHGEEALVALARKPFDVLFTDVGLPGISGVELARQALLIQPGLRIIFASGFGDTLTRNVEFPAVALQKPYDMQQLEQALDGIHGAPPAAA